MRHVMQIQHQFLNNRETCSERRWKLHPDGKPLGLFIPDGSPQNYVHPEKIVPLRPLDDSKEKLHRRTKFNLFLCASDEIY